MRIEAENAVRYIRHCDALAKLAGGGDGEAIYRSLRRIEARAHRQAERECNGELSERESATLDTRTKAQVAKLFNGETPAGFFINGDPRGYALKLKSEFRPEGLSQDLGGYGILAPKF